ncbi:MAG: DUF4403 family protein [Fusobacteriaceae bacterium]
MKKNNLIMTFLFLTLATYGENNSKFNIKTNIKKTAVEAFVEKSVPKTFSGDESISLDRGSSNNLLNIGLSFLGSIKPKYSPNVILNYTLNREKILFTLNNSNLSSQTNFNGSIVGNLDGSSQKFTSDFKGKLGVNSLVDLSENWELSTKTSPILNLEKVVLPVNVSISGFKINENISLKSQVSNKINPILYKAAADIDNKVKEIKLKAIVDNYWKGLSTPILLDSKSDIWLLLRPKTAYRGTLYSDENNISLSSGFQGDITIFVGKPDSVIDLGVLPKLKSTSQDLSKFNLNVPAIIKYEKLEALIDKNLGNKTFNIFEGINLKTKTTTLQKDNTLLKIKTNFSLNLFSIFNLDGTLLAKGTPEILENKVLQAKDFSFTIESDSFLLKLLDKFFHDKIQKIVEKDYLTLDFQNDLTGAKKLLEEKVSKFKIKENIYIENTIDELKITNVEIKEKEIIIYTNIVGNSNLQVNSLD